MEAALGQTSIDHLQTTDFNDAMAQARIQAGRFRIENDLSHAAFSPWSMASLAS